MRHAVDMEEPEQNSKRRKICRPGHDPEISTVPPYEGFQIEQIVEGGLRVVRIRNPSNSLQNINNDSTVQRGWTSQPTKGMKRTRDEINNGISTIKENDFIKSFSKIPVKESQSQGLPSDTTQPLQQATEGVHEDEGAEATRVIRQALKKQLKKRALVIQRVLTKRMDKLKSRMNQLELENKELQQLACNLRGALEDVIQQQKQKTDRMVSCGTQVNMALEGDLMVSRGTQVNVRVVFKPVIPSNKDRVIPRVLDVPCIQNDGKPGKTQLVYLPPDREVSSSKPNEEHLKQHCTEEDLHEQIRMGRAFSPIPSSLVDGKKISATVESLSSGDTTTQKDERHIYKSVDQAANGVRTISSASSLVAANPNVSSVSKMASVLSTPCSSGKPPEAQLSTRITLTSNVQTSQHETGITTSSVLQTNESQLCNHDGRQSTNYRSSTTRGILENKSSVIRTSSRRSSMAGSIEAPPQLTNTPVILTSPQKHDRPQNSSQLKPLLQSATSTLPSHQPSGVHKHFSSPQELHLPSAPSRLVPQHENGIQQRYAQQESQLKNEPCNPPTGQDRGMSTRIAQNESQLTKSSSSGVYNGVQTESKQKSISSLPLFVPNKRSALKKSQLSSNISSSPLSSNGLGDPRQQSETQNAQLSNEPSTLPSPQEYGLYKQIIPMIRSLQYRGESAQFKQNTPQESHQTDIPSSPRPSEELTIYMQCLPEQSKFPKTPSSLSSGWKYDIHMQDVLQESQLRNTHSSFPSSQSLSPRNEKSAVLSICSNCPPPGRPNTDATTPSSEIFSETEALREATLSTLSPGLSKPAKRLQTPGPSTKLSSKKLRSLIVKQTVAESSQQRTHCETNPSKLVVPHYVRKLPAASVKSMASHSNSHLDGPRKVVHYLPNSQQESSPFRLPNRSNTNINCERPTVMRHAPPRNIPKLQRLSRQDLDFHAKSKKGNRQQNQKLKLNNFPGSSSSSFKLVTVSQASYLQRSGEKLTESVPSDETEYRLQAQQIENSPWSFVAAEKSISDSFMQVAVDKKCFSSEVMEMHSQTGICTSATKKNVQGYNGPRKILQNNHLFGGHKTADRYSSKFVECDPRISFHNEGCPLSQ